MKKMMIVAFAIAVTMTMCLAFAGCGSSGGVAGSYHCVKVEQVGEMTIDQTDSLKDYCSLILGSNGEATVTLQGVTTEGIWEEDGDQVNFNGGELTFYKTDAGDLSLTRNEGLFTYEYLFEK